MSAAVTAIPGKRGGAGDVGTSITVAGPACAPERVMQLTFAIRLAKTSKTNAKRAAAVVEHLDAVPGAVVTDERDEGSRLWLTVHVWPPLRLGEAMRLAEGCPEYVKGTAAAGGALR